MSSCQPGIEETDLIEEQVDYWNEGSSIDLQFVVLLFISLSDLSAILLSSKVTSLIMCFSTF
jgi:hypothetical protein